MLRSTAAARGGTVECCNEDKHGDARGEEITPAKAGVSLFEATQRSYRKLRWQGPNPAAPIIRPSIPLRGFLPPTGPRYVLLVTTLPTTRDEFCRYRYARPRIVLITIAMSPSFAESNLIAGYPHPSHTLLCSSDIIRCRSTKMFRDRP